MTKKFALTTLGCKVNQYDSQLIRENLRALGYGESPPGAPADICIVNTCALTLASEAKSRRAVSRAVRENPAAAVVVTGCCAEMDPAAWTSLPGVTRVVGNEMKGKICRILGGRDVPGVLTISGFSHRARAFVKIQDGCDSRCSYCIVPHVRGGGTSRPEDDIVKEVTTLASRGYAEIVLCGIHLGSYGRDRGERGSLARLIRRLGGVERLGRIRLSSIEPEDVDEELIDIMGGGGTLCSHLHIPLQSGDAAVLMRMNRRYGPGDYRRLVDKIRGRSPDTSLTTDIMVGFPGESEGACDNTIAMVGECEFSRVHVFSHSPRPGTPAWEWGDPVSPVVKEKRRERVSDAAERAARAYRGRFVGRDMEVLFLGTPREGRGANCGLSREYIRVRCDGEQIPAGTLEKVRVTGVTKEGLRGEIRAAQRKIQR